MELRNAAVERCRTAHHQLADPSPQAWARANLVRTRSTAAINGRRHAEHGRPATAPKIATREREAAVHRHEPSSSESLHSRDNARDNTTPMRSIAPNRPYEEHDKPEFPATPRGNSRPNSQQTSSRATERDRGQYKSEMRQTLGVDSPTKPNGGTGTQQQQQCPRPATHNRGKAHALRQEPHTRDTCMNNSRDTAR